MFKVYLGDSATLSYLQSIRRLVERSIGICSFTSDKLRNQFLEASPVFSDPAKPESIPSLSLSDVSELTKQFFIAVSGVLDLFNPSFITDRLPAFVEDPGRAQWPDCALFYLVLAIGAQVRASNTTHNHAAELYFNLGRHYVTRSLVDEPILVTVQALCLVSWYMLTACRRNGALMNLGIAVQAAYALGIHRHEANILFEHDARMLRERAWKSLRVCDLFLSASMGRPSTTSNVDCNIQVDLYTNRLSSAMTRICIIFERILSEMYAKHAVSLDIAASISRQHRKWTKELPHMLEFDRLSSSDHGSTDDMVAVVGQSVVVMAYYYSVILLTRPFLMFCVGCHLKGQNLWLRKATEFPDETVYADACVDSAIKSMEVVRRISSLEGLPRRMPVMINHVFISALTVGLACFADYERRGWALVKTLNQSIEILEMFGVHNHQAARYKQIIELLQSASIQYTRRSDNKALESRNLQLINVFGSISTGRNPERASITVQTEAGQSPRWNTGNVESLDNREPDFTSLTFPYPSEGETMLQSMDLIPTLGAFGPLQDSGSGGQIHQNPSGDTDTSNWSAFYGDDYPLFEILNGFEQ